MTFSWSSSVPRRIAAPSRIGALLLALVAAGTPALAQLLAADAGWRTVTLEEYRQHLEQLEGVVTDCAAQQKLKGAPAPDDNACDPTRVGPDDRVSGAVQGDAQPREVRYDWLRAVLARAGHKAVLAQPGAVIAIPAKPAPQPSVNDQLAEARARLEADELQAAGPVAAGSSYAAERQTLSAILSEKAYQGVTEVSAAERFREWLNEQLDRFFASLVRFGARSRWIGRTLLALLLLGVGVALVWIFVRIERSSRIKLIPDDFGPVPGAPSAREWQFWLKDAQAMAAKSQWRDGIHALYWAAISRLESRRLWPADRARTPREYLSLVSSSDPGKPTVTAQTLTSLTRSFERTWYGGRAADPADFDAAMELASSLGVKPE